MSNKDLPTHKLKEDLSNPENIIYREKIQIMAPSATTDAPTEGYKPKHIEDRLYINGEFVPSKSGKKFDIINPNNENFAASVYEAGAEDVDDAVKAAQAAFPAWSALSAGDRQGYLTKLADAIERNLEEIGYLEAISMGKPYIGDCKLRIEQLSVSLLTCSSLRCYWRPDPQIFRRQSP